MNPYPMFQPGFNGGATNTGQSPKCTKMSAVEVSISGHSELHRYPERGILSIEISSTSLSQKDASENVRATTELVSKHFKTLYGSAESGAAITLYTINPLMTSATRKWKMTPKGTIAYTEDGVPEKSWLEFDARVTGDVTFCDFAKMSETATFLSTTKYVNIRNTKWILLAETKKSLLAQSVGDAYADAMVKAQAYADQMRLHTIRAVKIVDMGRPAAHPVAGHSHGIQMQQMLMERQHKKDELSESSGTSLGFAPKLVTMSGDCQVDFQIF